jgi:isochorismate synthase
MLRSRVEQARQQEKHSGKPVLVSVTEPTWPLDVIDVFDRARLLTADRFFWSQPGEGFALVGLGIAWALDAVEESRFRQTGASWQQLLDKAIVEGPRGLPGAGPLLFGGFAFDPLRAGSQLWQGYPDGRLVLPKVLLTTRNGEGWLTCNVLISPDSDPDLDVSSVETLRDELLTPGAAYPHRGNHRDGNLRVAKRESMPAAEWQTRVRRTLGDIASGKLEKAVLARAVDLEALHPFDAARALRQLSDNYPGCFVFAIARGEQCFLGATPERLAELHDGAIRTMALAGSIRRGATAVEDRQLGEQLLASAKDRHEHEVVVRTVVEALGPLCDQLDVGATPSLLKLGNVQHLYTPVTGHLCSACTLLNVVERLHPTPAVGGRPREAALALIREREGFDRGWYGGPVGWIDQRGEGEFAVAIRSALLHGTQATLFAGCGIVADSDPEREYAEAALKLKPMLSALGAE